MEQMQGQAEHVGTRLVRDVIVDVDFTQRPYRAVGDSGDIYLGDAVVIATGAQARWLGLESEEKYQGFGVLHVQPVTVSSIVSGKWSWSAAEIRRLKKHCS